MGNNRNTINEIRKNAKSITLSIKKKDYNMLAALARIIILNKTEQLVTYYMHARARTHARTHNIYIVYSYYTKTVLKYNILLNNVS